MRAQLPTKLGPYPSHLLDGAHSALFLFGAGFLGANDAAHALAADLNDVTVVDNDATLIEKMRPLYPPSWRFEVADAFEFACNAVEEQVRYDVVTVDPPMALIPACSLAIGAFLDIANNAVVIGSLWTEAGEVTTADLHLSVITRSSLVSWAVYEKIRPDAA